MPRHDTRPPRTHRTADDARAGGVPSHPGDDHPAAVPEGPATADAGPFLDRLAVDLDGHDADLAARHGHAVAALARRHGLASPSLTVLVDPAAPTVARTRALTVVSSALIPILIDHSSAP